MEKKNVPKIRFPGFTEPWEQRKLSELATIHARIGWQNLRTSEFLDNGDYMLITGTDFKDGAINYSTCHYVEKERYDQDKHIQINNGSILITKDGTLGKVAYVQGLTMPATLNAGIFNVQIRNENEVDGKYLFQYLKAPYLMNYVSQKATGGTIKHLNQNILVDFPIVLPNKFEQVKIGTFFEKLDNLISLHHRKLENLKKQKKGLLQKMFPEKGKKVPEMRFPEFTNDWEQRKLSEITTTIETGKSKFQSKDSGLYEILGSTSVIGYDDSYDYEGDFLLTARVGANAGNLYKYSGKVKISDNTVFIQCDNINFIYYLLMKSDIKKLSFGTGQPLVKASELKEQNLLIPTSKDERIKIGIFFEKIDNLISLYQRKLEHLQKQKKALLQQMFV